MGRQRLSREVAEGQAPEGAKVRKSFNSTWPDRLSYALETGIVKPPELREFARVLTRASTRA